MCRRIEHVGPIGAGASMKLAINLPLLVFWQAFGEALALVRPLGLGRRAPRRHLQRYLGRAGGAQEPRTCAHSGDSRARTPAQSPSTSNAMRKDLRTMVEEAKALGPSCLSRAGPLECLRPGGGSGPGQRGHHGDPGALDEAELRPPA